MGQSPSAPKITAQDRAIYQLKQQRDKLKQYQRKLDHVIARQTELARDALKRNQPERAKVYLRSKKQQESTIAKTYEQLGNLEHLIGTIEFKLIEKDVVQGLTIGSDVLKRLNTEMSVERIDKLLDTVDEENMKAAEISDMLGMTGLSLSNGEENEVDEELRRLEAEAGIAPKLPEAPSDDIKEQPRLPDAPTQPVQETEEEREEQETQEQGEDKTAIPAT
ncbi:Charged multivesicular body protein 6 [Meyerozyma sp. JA9]|nr:Charged multivesicular body protein 6 [Meyerozyma sp. JA9]